MHHRLTLALLAVVLVASLAAVIAIQLIERAGSPVGVPTVTAWISPAAPHAGDGVGDTATVHLRMRHRRRVGVTVVDHAGHDVRVLVAERARLGPLTLHWNGRDAHDQVVPDGSYRVRIDLDGGARRIVVPSPIHVDTAPPSILSLRIDGTRTSTFRIVRAYARVRDATTTMLELDGRRLNTSQSVATDQPDGSVRLYLVAALPDDLRLTRGMHLPVTLVVRDRAGNAARRSGVAVVPTVVHCRSAAPCLASNGPASGSRA